MSTRFDAASDRISRSGAMFAVGSGFTMTAWAYVSVDTDTNSTFARLHTSSGGSTVITWATDSDGLAGPNYFTGGGSVSNSTNMAVGQWRKIAISCSGTTGKSYVATVGGSTEVDSGTVSVGTPDGITLGGRAPADSSEPFNGRLAYVRIWSSELTQVQIEAEWASATPVITANLWADWPLTDSTDLTDHSGNGRNLTAGSTAVSTEADPPLSNNVTGTASAAFGALAATANGTPKVVATASAAFGSLTASASGTPTVTGTAVGSFGGLTATGTGTRKIVGSGSFNGGSLSASSTGQRTVVATASAAFGALTATGSQPSTVTGTADTDFGSLTGTARGTTPAPTPVGSWGGLISIVSEAVQLATAEREQQPVACFDCGEPLRPGPNGEMFCPFDGSMWSAGNRRTYPMRN